MNGRFKDVTPWTAALAGLLLAAGGAQTQTEQVAPRTLPPGDYTAPATVECATFMGTPGSEVLSAAVFLPDGRILIGGISQDPEITLLGVKARVVGTDAPPMPELKAWKPLGAVDTGKVATLKIEDALSGIEGDTGLGGARTALMTDKELAAEKKRLADEATLLKAIPPMLKWTVEDEKNVGKGVVYRKLSWLDPECTAFWGVFSADLKSVSGLWRLPRGAGSITAMGIAQDGSVAIAGGATERIRGACADAQILPAVSEARKAPAYSAPFTYAARLTPDYSGLAWVRMMPMDAVGPKLRVLRVGDIMTSDPDIRRFNADGKLVFSSPVSRSRYPDSVALNPVTGGWCKGGDFMSMTGREPYRSPYFFIFNPDGSLYLELWRWHGAFAAVDALGHLVADAQVEKIAYDEQGNLIVSARSHGGNCVHARYPWDITRMLPGGGRFASSPGSVVKISPDYKLVAGRGIGDPGFLNRVEHGVDGSVVLMMKVGSGRTENALSDAPDRGGIAIWSPDLKTRRFASSFPGVGEVLLIGGESRPEDWASATGWSQNRPKLLLLSGAQAGKRIGEQAWPTPVKNPVQASFAGGRLDGYAVLLDLSPGPPKAEQPPVERSPTKKKETSEPAPLMPVEGQRFELRKFEWATVHIDLREEPEGDLWPRFYDGRAAPGDNFTVSLAGDSLASFTLHGQYLQQHDGNQDRRLFGARLRSTLKPNPVTGKNERLPDPAINLKIDRMGPWRAVPYRRETEDRIVSGSRVAAVVSGVFHVGNRAMPMKDAECIGSFSVPRGVDGTRPGAKPNYVCLRIRFKAKARDMGFTDADVADKTIAVLFSATGFAEAQYEENKKLAPPPMLEGEGGEGK